MTTFNQAHHGDKVRICLPNGLLTQPLRLLVDPAPCSDSCCLALHARGVDRMGWIEPIQAYADTEITVLELGPASSPSECPTPGGDAVAEHVDTEDTMSAHLAAQADEPEAWPIPRDPANPAEAEMTEEDEAQYEQEKRT
ncbi:hypothetical protein AB0395_32725 [Streptosporangium sp. NPDC051023]|uniref:hypothetical protein n=1 Tax=Streptosporangium sp. NPDC051023 TaxID=3155410 RepID=UPI00344D4BFC